MTDHYHIAVVGSGPAGLSAAARAAQRDRALMDAGELTEPTHILLESSSQPAKTIQRYQKGKLVMAEPGFLQLRSDCEFEAGSREAILEQWQNDIERNRINVRYEAEVQAITGEQGNFSLALADGDVVTASFVILAIGMEGNPRKLNVPGENDPAVARRVQYTLDDPDAYTGERIVVVGAGDSALENALALSQNNHVTIINRRAEFTRAKEGNLNAILKAINDRRISLDCLYETSPAALEANDDGGVDFTLEMPTGRKAISCDRVIARLGAFPPRRFIESIGIEFSSDAIDAAPALNAHYESSVPGIYVVGSLAGYPLIKQAMNQGYDVVEYIHGNPIKPADHELLEFQFGVLPYRRSPDELLALFQQRIPMFSQLNVLVFRQLIMESTIWTALDGPAFEDAQGQAEKLNEAAAQRQPQPSVGKLIQAGETIFRRGDYSSTFFMIVDGEVILERPDQDSNPIRLERGQFFGEGSLVSGRPRESDAVAGSYCVLVETPRRTMISLLNSNDEVRRGIDWVFTVRALQNHFAPGLSPEELRGIAQTTQINTYQAGEPLFRQGEEGDCLHVIRRGAVTLERSSEDGDLVVAQLQVGELVGEMALMGEPVRRHTATASVLTETIEVQRESFVELVNLDPSSVSDLQAEASRHARTYTSMQAQADKGSLIGFLMDEGMGEATNAMVIDETLCIGCDECEKACADTHDGISRLNRAEGGSFAQVHLAISCRHCEHPHCMKDCPPDAIHRAQSGEVFIDDTCIGCGNCVSNCPYDAIELANKPPPRKSLISWLLKGAPDRHTVQRGEADDGGSDPGKKAVKCDACMDRHHGPACVNACPTGAAARLAADDLVRLVEKQ